MENTKEAVAPSKIVPVYQQMFQNGGKGLINTGIKLLPEHAFGFPSYEFSPNLIHYTNGTILTRIYSISSWEKIGLPRFRNIQNELY